MTTTDAKNNLQTQLDSQALAERVTVDRKDLECVLQYIDDVRDWYNNAPSLRQAMRPKTTEPQPGSSDIQSRTISVPEAGKILGISQSKAYQLAQRGEFPVRILQLGRMKRVSISDLEAFLSGGQGSRGRHE